MRYYPASRWRLGNAFIRPCQLRGAAMPELAHMCKLVVQYFAQSLPRESIL
jgi:hypothetical protein